MIPVRVSLKNFLTYSTTRAGEPVVFDFDDAKLWSIWGSNGTGKTTVFDAITYCLFGEHRGGSQRDERLIRKGAATAEVTFEFRHAEALYRIRRTVSRRPRRAGGITISKDVQAAEWDPPDGAWRPLPGTNSEAGIRDWVDRRLCMTIDVFCSTVLLQQGKADRLLTATPQARFDVLAGLLDLDVYQRLAGRAADRRRQAAADTRAIEARLDATPAVSTAMLQAAQVTADRSTQAVHTAHQRRAAAQATLEGAKTVATLNNAATKARHRLKDLGEILAAADRIRNDLAKYTRTRAALEPVRLATADVDTAAGHDDAGDHADTQRQAIDLEALTNEAAHARDAFEGLEAERNAVQLRYELLSGHVPLMERLLHTAAEAARRRRDADAAGDPAMCQQRLDRTTVAERTAVADRQAAADTKQDAVEAHGQHVGHRQALADQLTTRESVKEGPCSRCGQPVTAEHLARELAELGAAIAAADATITKAKDKVNQASAELVTAENAETKAHQACAQARAALAAAKTAAREAADADQARTKATAAAAAALPTDWLAVTDDPDKAATFLDAVTAELTDLREKRLPHLRRAATRADDAATKAATDLTAAQTRLQQLIHDTDQARQLAVAARQRAQVRLATVDPTVAAAVLAGTQGVYERLAATVAELGHVEAEAEALQHAEDEHRRVVGELTAAVDALAAIPRERHVEVAKAQTALETADADAQQAVVERDNAHDRHRRLTEQAASRTRLEQEHQAARRTAARAGRLEELFGRRGLQAALLDQAKGAIEALANETLMRVSGGQLSIVLEVGEGTGRRKLEVLVTDNASADEPLEVAFVSGSQKFRIAVALAAGLGQHLAGAEATRALIIDEGFASLDDLGRQGMIDELHTLAGQLDRVIVVSHQADFADTTYFRNGYLLKKIGRYTEVNRLIA